MFGENNASSESESDDALNHAEHIGHGMFCGNYASGEAETERIATDIADADFSF